MCYISSDVKRFRNTNKLTMSYDFRHLSSKALCGVPVLNTHTLTNTSCLIKRGFSLKQLWPSLLESKSETINLNFSFVF